MTMREDDGDWRVYKYKCKPGVFELKMPLGAEILHFGVQLEPCMWARVNTLEPEETRRFAIVPTGLSPAPSPSIGTYVGTCLQHGGLLVWHLFEINMEKATGDGRADCW